MILCDVNVLLYAFREDAPDHRKYARWLRDAIRDSEAFGISDIILSGFLRIATHPRIFSPPTPLDEALAFANALRALPNAVTLSPGPRHWGIFEAFCAEASAKGNLVPDAFFAALAVEKGATWISTDSDFARFSRLDWQHPLQ